jgi:putative salt-induced outer membrane protein YdiY
VFFAIALGHGIPLVHGDAVRMNNGDRLTGTVLHMEADLLELRTSYAGTIKISWSEVANIELDEPQQLLVGENEVIETTGLRREQGDKIVLTSGRNEKTRTLDEEELRILNPTRYELNQEGKFTGRFNLSWKDEKGNTDKDDLDADLKLGYRRSRHGFGLRGSIEYDDRDGAPTKRDWDASGSYEYFWDNQWVGKVWYEAKHEKSSGLDLRQITGPSLGYQFLDNDRAHLLSHLGVMYVNERYNGRPDDEFVGPTWMLDMEYKFLDGRITFYNDHYFIINGENADKRLWQSWTGVRYPIAGGVVGSLEYELEYDSEPSVNSNSLDRTLRLKIGYEW